MTDTQRLTLFSNALATGMQSLDRLVTLCHLVLETESVPGAIVEIGCRTGTTAALLASLTDKPMFLYDSFEGLSEPGPEDGTWLKAGDNRASVRDVLSTFAEANVRPPTIMTRWVEEMTPDDLPKEISFLHCDLDLYGPTLKALNLTWPKLSPGAVCVVDDVFHESLPGVGLAMREFCTMRVGYGRQTKSIHAYFIKPYSLL